MHQEFIKEIPSDSNNWVLQKKSIPLRLFINRGYLEGRFLKSTMPSYHDNEFENEENDFGFILPPVKDVIPSVLLRKIEPSSVEFSKASLSTSPFSELALPSSAFSKLELSPATLPSIEVFDASSEAWSIDEIF